MSALGDRLAANLSGFRHSVEITIAGDKVELFARPMTGSDLDKLVLRHKDFGQKVSAAAMVDSIIMMAELEDGTKAFDVGDKALLLKQPLEWLAKIKSGLMPDEDQNMSDEAVQDAVKN